MVRAAHTQQAALKRARTLCTCSLPALALRHNGVFLKTRTDTFAAHVYTAEGVAASPVVLHRSAEENTQPQRL